MSAYLSISAQLSSQHIKSICLPTNTSLNTFCPSLILVAYVQEAEVSARQVSQATSHILTHLQYALQFFSRLCPLHRFRPFVSFIVVTRVQFMYFYLNVVLLCCCFFNGFSFCFVVRSLNHTQSIECACVCMFGCMGLCLCV